MTIFGPGIIRERTTRRPVAGAVVQVTNPATDLPIPTVHPVVTDADGYYPEFETIPSIDHVYLRAGDHVQHAVAVGSALLAPELEARLEDLESRSGTSVLQLRRSVPTSADLPTEGNEAGDARITEDTGHVWVWDGEAWVNTEGVGGGGGVTDHGDLTGRSAPDQHPISAISGLQSALDGKAEAGHTHTAAQISDATTTGRAVMRASSATAARTAIGAGTSNLALGAGSTTAAAGNHTHDDRYTRHIVLDPGDPVPPSTPEGTLILRRVSASGGKS